METEVLDEAVELYTRSAERRERVLGKGHRDVGIARMGLAGALVERGDHLKALEEFKRASELDPKQHVIFANLAESYKNLRKYDEAVENYNKALAFLF